MHIIEINHIKKLRAHIENWEILSSRVTDSSSIFLSQSWILNWWHVFGNDNTLSLLLDYNDSQMVGIAPLFIYSKKTIGIPFRHLKFIGTDHADHVDFCIDPEFRKDALESLIDHIVDKIKWDVLDLTDIPEDSKNFKPLIDLMRKKRIAHDIRPAIICPYLPLNGDGWKTYYAGKRSKSTRKDLRRRLNRLKDRGSVEFRRYADPAGIIDTFPKLFDVYEKRWRDKNLTVSFAGNREKDFYPQMAADLARTNQLHLLTLELDGDVIAFTLSAFKGTQFTWLITAFDPKYRKYFAGEQIIVKLLEDVFEQGRFKEFDFTRGDEPYKFKWTDKHRWNRRILAHNHHLLSILPYASIRLYSKIRQEAKKYDLMRKIKLEYMGKIKSLLPIGSG